MLRVWWEHSARMTNYSVVVLTPQQLNIVLLEAKYFHGTKSALIGHYLSMTFAIRNPTLLLRAMWYCRK